jgi:hypothetical protein
VFEREDAAEHVFAAGRHGYVHVARGRVRVGEHELVAGDGLAISDEACVQVRGIDRGELLLFDLG